MKTLLRLLPVNLLILLFVYAAISKLADVDAFRWQLRNQTIPQGLADAMVYALPFTELLAALLLAIPKLSRYGIWLSLGLMMVFTGYIALVLLHFWSRVPCSCGGVLNKLGWRAHLAFNIFFLLLSITAIVQQSNGGSRKPGTE